MLLRRDRAMTAIAIVLDVAFYAGQGTAVSAAEIAGRLAQARRGIEPVLQALVRAKLLLSVRGPRGGYRLDRPHKELRLMDIAAAVSEADPAMQGPVDGLQAAVLLPLWDELEAACRARLDALTIDDLLRRAASAGLRRPGQLRDLTPRSALVV